MPALRLCTLALAAALLTRCAAPNAHRRAEPAPPRFEGAALLTGTVAGYRAACDAALSRAKEQVAALESLGAAERGARALELYDDAAGALTNASLLANFTREVHPDPAFRAAAQDCEKATEAAKVELAQNRAVYDALERVDASRLDPTARWLLTRTLSEFRRTGVQLDAATRAKVKALNASLVATTQEFETNIAADTRTLKLLPADLEGLPKDFIDSHPPGPDGRVTVTTDYPDYLPFSDHARRAGPREQLWRLFRQRGDPKNAAVLDKLIADRHALAQTLGYPSWAAYVLEPYMTARADTVEKFLDEVAKASEAPARAEAAMLLKRKQQDEPKAQTLEPWDYSYYQDRVAQERLHLDSSAVRQYFEFASVERGVLAAAERTFGIRFQRVEAKTWHPEVETYDVFDGTRLLGRVYLDLHPRPDKYKHEAQFDLVFGQEGKRLPEGALVCNFARPGGLLELDDVITFFHELGHLVHSIVSGHGRWQGLATGRELDFIEAPSMLFQQWPLQPEVLATFAKNAGGEPMPKEMIEKLRASNELGKGLWARRHTFFSRVSLAYFSREPGFDRAQVALEAQRQLAPLKEEYREGTRFELSFGHLTGYSAAYYTYLWSLALAKDFEQAFAEHGYFDAATAQRYRKAVLEPGGAKPAAELVHDFLGRDSTLEAYRAYLAR